MIQRQPGGDQVVGGNADRRRIGAHLVEHRAVRQGHALLQGGGARAVLEQHDVFRRPGARRLLADRPHFHRYGVGQQQGEVAMLEDALILGQPFAGDGHAARADALEQLAVGLGVELAVLLGGRVGHVGGDETAQHGPEVGEQQIRPVVDQHDDDVADLQARPAIGSRPVQAAADQRLAADDLHPALGVMEMERHGRRRFGGPLQDVRDDRVAVRRRHRRLRCGPGPGPARACAAWPATRGRSR